MQDDALDTELLSLLQSSLAYQKSESSSEHNPALDAFVLKLTSTSSMALTSQQKLIDTCGSFFQLIYPLSIHLKTCAAMNIIFQRFSNQNAVVLFNWTLSQLQYLVSRTPEILESVTDTECHDWLVLMAHVLDASYDAQQEKKKARKFATLFHSTVVHTCVTKCCALLPLVSEPLYSAILWCFVSFSMHMRRANSGFIRDSMEKQERWMNPVSQGLVHGLNQLGYPCFNSTYLHEVLLVVQDIFRPKSSTSGSLFYHNDFHLLIDIIVRDIQNLDLVDPGRLWYLQTLESIVRSPMYRTRYRAQEIYRIIQNIQQTLAFELDQGPDTKSQLFLEITQVCQHMLIDCIQYLD